MSKPTNEKMRKIAESSSVYFRVREIKIVRAFVVIHSLNIAFIDSIIEFNKCSRARAILFGMSNSELEGGTRLPVETNNFDISLDSVVVALQLSSVLIRMRRQREIIIFE